MFIFSRNSYNLYLTTAAYQFLLANPEEVTSETVSEMYKHHTLQALYIRVGNHGALPYKLSDEGRMMISKITQWLNDSPYPDVVIPEHAHWIHIDGNLAVVAFDDWAEPRWMDMAVALQRTTHNQPYWGIVYSRGISLKWEPHKPINASSNGPLSRPNNTDAIMAGLAHFIPEVFVKGLRLHGAQFVRYWEPDISLAPANSPRGSRFKPDLYDRFYTLEEAAADTKRWKDAKYGRNK